MKNTQTFKGQDDQRFQALVKEYQGAVAAIKVARGRVDELRIQAENLTQGNDTLEKEINKIKNKEDEMLEQIVEGKTDKKNLEEIKKELKQKQDEFGNSKKLVEVIERLIAKTIDSFPELQKKTQEAKGNLLVHLFDSLKDRLKINIDEITKAWAYNALMPAEAGYRPAAWHDKESYKDLLILLFPMPTVEKYEAAKREIGKEILDGDV